MAASWESTTSASMTSSSDLVILSLRTPPDSTIEVEGLTADRLAKLEEAEIAALPAWVGKHRACLGDFFSVRGGHSARVRLEGDLGRVDGLAAGMTAGEILIDGDAGRRVGHRMKGGWVDVRGSVADDAGVGMSGGALRVTGDAGDRVASASPGAFRGMTGGEIVVGGSAGADTAARLRRGLVVIAGGTGENAARAAFAGTLVVLGRTGPNPGRGNKRASIVAAGGIDVPETYRYACTLQPPWVRLLMTYLRRQYGVRVEDRVLDGRYRRYCGDAGDPGKGEILAFVPLSPRV
jgi:formylmethanofuran dehydrogenase subunit C